MTITGNFQLLKIKEQIGENLGSLQIIKTLDKLIFNALEPMLLHTDFLDYTLVELLPHIILNKRRKFSNKPFEELKDNLFSAIMMKDRQEKIILLSKQGLERSVYFAALTDFEKNALVYLKQVSLQLQAISENKPFDTSIIEFIKQDSLIVSEMYGTSQSVIFWLHNAFEFKKMIVEKYIRHAFNEAKKMGLQTALQIDADDLFRDLILSIHKAIDKYDQEKGTMTQYINIWFMEAKTNYHNAHEYGVAYNMPTSKRKQLLDEGSIQSITLELNEAIAESIEDDSQNTLTNIMEDQNTIMINNLACRSDRHKSYCLLYGITYTLTEKDIAKQRRNYVQR